MYKKILLIATFFCAAILNVSAQREKLDALFDQYQDSEGVTSIKISKPMFGMLNKLNFGDGELDQIKPLLSKINGLKILILEKPNEKLVNGKNVKSNLNYSGIQNNISSILKGLKYEELMSVNRQDNKIKFLSAGSKDGILDDLLINIFAEDNSVLMMLDGKISMDDVNKLVNEPQSFSTSNSFTNSGTSSSEGKVNNRDSEERNLGSFTGIEVSSGIKVNFTQGDKQEVRVETDEDKLQYISTVVQGNTLKISIKNPSNKKLSFNKIFVNVVAPEITKISTSSGSSFVVLNTIIGNQINIETTSGSLLNGDFDIKNGANISTTSGSNLNLNIKVPRLNFEGTSGSNAVINGNVSQVNFEVTSAANCNAQNLLAENVEATATSAGNLSINVMGNLKAEASSGGKIRYIGNPKNIDSNISKISGGKLIKFD
jgi:hypothetical protein